MALESNQSLLKRIVGVGINFPFRFSQTGGVLMVGNTDTLDSIEVIRQSIWMILTTRLGERIIRRDFGSPLEAILFDPLSSPTLQELKEQITTVLAKFEPRATITNIDIIQDPVELSHIELNISFVVNRTNQAGNIVFPFFLNSSSF